jgi:hypothetical protein
MNRPVQFDIPAEKPECNLNALYVLAGLGTYPNAGRNTFPLSPIDNIDPKSGSSTAAKPRSAFAANTFQLLRRSPPG